MIAIEWSPHSRYRLYTSRTTYRIPLGETNGAIQAFEAEVCRRFGVAAAVCVPMARTGLFLTLSEMIRPGQKVILSPLTIADAVNAVILAGGIPIFADINPSSCAMDINAAGSLIDHSTGALLLTHLHGQTGGAHAFRELCQCHGLPLVEDAAQAFGAIEGGRRLGTIGDAGVYSFGFYKHLTTWRGGMVVSNNVTLIDRIRKRVRNLQNLSGWRLSTEMLRGLVVDAATAPSIFATLVHPMIRRNVKPVTNRLDPERDSRRRSHIPKDWLYRMDDIQGRIGIEQLDAIDRHALCRIERAALYHSALGGLGGITTSEHRDDLSNIYTYFPIQISDRDLLLHHSHLRQRDFGAQHLRNCADLPFFAEFRRDCPNARKAAAELVLLPTYPRYPLSEVEKNIATIREFIQEY
jgi:perosamine synthetase